MVVGIRREVVGFGDLRHQLFDQELRKPRRERVVLEDALVSVLGPIGKRRHHAGIQENRDHRRNVPPGNQVIQDDRHTYAVARIAAAIQKIMYAVGRLDSYWAGT